MEHILISPGKLKLMLTKTDLTKYALDCDTMDSEDPTTRRALRELLRDVKSSSGFDAADDKLFIQLYPSKDGGAEIYITKLAVRRDPEPALTSGVRISTVYRFDTMGDLLSACSRANTCHHTSLTDVTAWQGERSYYLITEDNLTYREYLRGTGAQLGEQLTDSGICIGTSPAVIAYVREHCTCFCDCDAISVLGALA